MSITIRFSLYVNGDLTDGTSVALQDETATYGVKRDDTDAVVVAAGTAMTHDGTGLYSYEFTEPAEGLDYSYVVQYVYGGVTYYYENTCSDVTKVVSLTEAKSHLRVTGTDDDTLINRLIDAATTWSERYTGRKFLTQTCVDYFDAWPAVIRPQWSPLLAVSSITYVDDAGSTQTWDSGDYDVDIVAEPGRVAPAYGEDYPSIRGDMNGITVTYTAGYGTAASDVPEEYRNAILMLVGHWYEQREASIDGTLSSVPYGVRDLLGIGRVFTL